MARLRKAVGFSQANLAVELGISTQQYGKYERGENRMPSGRYEKALEVLGITTPSPLGFAEDTVRYDAHESTKAVLEKKLEQIRTDLDFCIEIVRRL